MHYLWLIEFTRVLNIVGLTSLSCTVPVFPLSVADDGTVRVSATVYYDSFGSRHDEQWLSVLLL